MSADKTSAVVRILWSGAEASSQCPERSDCAARDGTGFVVST